MRGILTAACIAGAVLAAPASAFAVAALPSPSITGELNLVGNGGVNFGGGTATMAVFSALGLGAVTAGNQTGSFAILAPCASCVTFGSPVVTSGQSTYTYGPVLSTTISGNDTTYTHGPASGLPLFTLNDASIMSTFTPVGDVTIDKMVTSLRGRTSTTYTLTALGTLTLTGYAPTEGMFSITSQGSAQFASYSATADAAPAPLAGAGLLSFAGAGLVGLRKRGRRLMSRLSSRLATA